jgi:hypothetical protein
MGHWTSSPFTVLSQNFRIILPIEFSKDQNRNMLYITKSYSQLLRQNFPRNALDKHRGYSIRCGAALACQHYLDRTTQVEGVNNMVWCTGETCLRRWGKPSQVWIKDPLKLR